jgi:hypothetical protein
MSFVALAVPAPRNSGLTLRGGMHLDRPGAPHFAAQLEFSQLAAS